MSILKQATFQILSASMAGQTERINRTAHRAEFQYDPKPGFLYVRSRAISSRINENFDGFPAEEIKKSYASFNGKPVFVNHVNENHRRARGVIIDSALHEDVNPDGSPDVWVEVLMEIDSNFPKLAKAILAGHIERTSMGCFIPGTLITLADGSVKPIEEIELGDEVLTHTGKLEPVTYVMERPWSGPVYEFTTYGQGAPLTMTPEHPVWLRRDGVDQWVEAQYVNKGDQVLTPLPDGVGHPGTYAQARLLGYYLAEGNLGYDRKRHGDSPRWVEWNFHSDEIEYVEEVCAHLRTLGYRPAGPYIKNNCASIRCNSPELAAWFLTMGRQHSWNKHLAPEVLRWDPENQRALVMAYLNGDGCYRANRVEVGTASEALAHQIHLLALRAGIAMTPPTRQHSPSAMERGSRPKFVLQAVLEAPERPLANRTVVQMDDQGMWRKVTGVRVLQYEGNVYNFDVEGDDSYVAGDVAVHNCDVEYSECTFCGNKAHTPQQYCAHIPRLKGKRIRRKAADGSYEDVLVAEMCYGIMFFENSLLVEDPADPTAFFLGVDARGLAMTASKTASDVPDYIPVQDMTDEEFDEFMRSLSGYGVEQGRIDAMYETRRNGYTASRRTAEMFPGAGAQVYTNEAGEPLGWDSPSQDETAGMDPYDDYDDRGSDDEDVLLGQHEVGEHDDEYAPGCPECEFEKDANAPMRNENGWTASRANRMSDASLLQDMIEYEEMNERFASLVTADMNADTQKVHEELEDMDRQKSEEDEGSSTEVPYVNAFPTPMPGIPGMFARKGSFGGQRLASVRHTAIGEVVAPPEVDTLRADTCPICGSDAFNGEECPVCLYIQPPDIYMDPDPTVAQETDLRGGQNPENDVTPVGDDLMTGDLTCDTCAATVPDAAATPAPGATPPAAQPSAQTQMGATPASPEAPAPQPVENQIPPPEDPAPNGAPPPPDQSSGTPTVQAPAPVDDTDPNKKPPAGEFLPKPGTDNDPSKDKKEHDTEDSSKPKSDGPPKGDDDKNPFAKKDDSASADPSKPDDKDAPPPAHEGDPCPICGDGTLTKKDANTFNQDVGDDPSKDPSKGGDDGGNPFAKKDDDGSDADGDNSKNPDDSDKKDDDSEDDDDKKKGGPPWEKPDSSHEGVRVMSHDHTRSNAMAPRSSLRVIAAQQAEIRTLKAEARTRDAQIAWLHRAVNLTAEAVGLKPRTADAANPAQPIPSPGPGGAPSTTDQARQPAGKDSVDSIGSSPVNGVGADATETVDSIGGVVADAPYNVNQDVTVPVSGTEGRMPLDMVRTVPEIQFGNPMAPDPAFPLQGDFANKATVASQGRTFASLRLAKLRMSAGLVEANADELVVAAAISDDPSMSDRDIAREIETLGQVVTATRTATRQAPRPEGQRRLVPRAASGTRTPSMQGGPSSIGPSSSSDDDAFAFTD